LLYVPFLQNLFKTMPLSPLELLISLGLSSVIFWAVELEKMVFRRRNASAISCSSAA
jgi:Ca2+-transporting ATPase